MSSPAPHGEEAQKARVAKEGMNGRPVMRMSFQQRGHVPIYLSRLMFPSIPSRRQPTPKYAKLQSSVGGTLKSDAPPPIKITSRKRARRFKRRLTFLFERSDASEECLGVFTLLVLCISCHAVFDLVSHVSIDARVRFWPPGRCARGIPSNIGADNKTPNGYSAKSSGSLSRLVV